MQKTDQIITLLVDLKGTAIRWRWVLLIIGTVVFLSGTLFAVRNLDLVWTDILMSALLLNFLVLVPSTIVLAAVNLQILASAVNCRISFSEAFVISAVGRIAQVLPLPGGLIVRSIALVRAGASHGNSARITIFNGLLTLSLSFCLSGIAMTMIGLAAGYMMLAVGFGGMIFSLAVILQKAKLKRTFWILIQRLCFLGLAIIRIVVAFATIGVDIGGIQSMILIVSTQVTSAVSIVPAGIGLAESGAAGLAYLINISPAAAFIAVGLNFLLGLFFCGFVLLLAIAFFEIKKLLKMQKPI